MGVEMKGTEPSRTKRRLVPAMLLPALLVLSLLSAACTDADVDEWVDVALDWLASPDGAFTAGLGTLGVDKGSGTEEGDDALDAAKDIRALVESSLLRDEARALEENEDYQGAMDKYNEAVQTAPQDAQAWEARARFLDSMGQHEDAIEDYDEAISRNKKRGVASQGELYQARAAALLHAGEAKKALDDLARAEEAYEEAGERVPEHLGKDREIAQAHVRKAELVATGIVNQDGSINEEVFDQEWRKYSDFDDRIPRQSRSREVQQWDTASQGKADLIFEFFLLERDQAIEAEIRREALEYQQALARNEQQNVIKAFIRMSLLTYTTIKGTPGLGSGAVGLGKSYEKLFTGTGNLLRTEGGLQQLGHALNVIRGLTPEEAPYAFNTKELSGQVGSGSASFLIEAVQELGDPLKMGIKVVQETAGTVIPTDFKLSQDELNILKNQHEELGLIKEALDASYDAARVRRARMDAITDQVGQLDQERTRWEAAERDRVARALTSTYEKALQ